MATTARKKKRMYIIVLVYIEKPWWHGCGFDKLSTIYSLLFKKIFKAQICKVHINNRTHARYHFQIVGQRYNKKSRCASVAPANLRILKRNGVFFDEFYKFPLAFCLVFLEFTGIDAGRIAVLVRQTE